MLNLLFQDEYFVFFLILKLCDVVYELIQNKKYYLRYILFIFLLIYFVFFDKNLVEKFVFYIFIIYEKFVNIVE